MILNLSKNAMIADILHNLTNSFPYFLCSGCASPGTYSLHFSKKNPGGFAPLTPHQGRCPWTPPRWGLRPQTPAAARSAALRAASLAARPRAAARFARSITPQAFRAGSIPGTVVRVRIFTCVLLIISLRWGSIAWRVGSWVREGAWRCRITSLFPEAPSRLQQLLVVSEMVYGYSFTVATPLWILKGDFRSRKLVSFYRKSNSLIEKISLALAENSENRS